MVQQVAEFVSEDNPFILDDFGRDVFQRSYAFNKEETWSEASDRVATHIAGAEENGLKHRWANIFFGEVVSNRFMPGGRIWYSSGRAKAQGLNCFVIPVSDSREGWGEMLKESLIISGTGGGVGINFSPVRPNGSEIKGTGGYATGPVSLMRMDDGIGLELVAGGGRRMAKMSCLDINHPDILDFLNCKLQDKKLSTTNISVVINFDSNKFIQLIEEDGDIELSWSGVNTGETVKAREIWNIIVKNAWNNGEPGVLNSFFANQQNNIWYHKPLISTNPCGEIWLEAYGCCCLGSLVLPRFIKNKQMDWEQLEETIRISVRFLDNVLSVNHYPFDKIKENCEEVRRIGLGVMGLHTMLLDLGYKYSSDEALEFVDILFGFIKEKSYSASIDLAIEKGAFPAYDEKILESGFMKNMTPKIKSQIKQHGIRNCAIMTVAPTGTTGIVSGVSTGIEPYMAPVYWRRVKTVDEGLNTIIEKVLVVEPAYELYGDICEGAADIPVEKHFEMQRVVQRHVDNAVSKTINLPNNYKIRNLSRLWLKNLPYLKGTTFYRWGSREDEPFEPVLKNDIELLLRETPEYMIRRKERTQEGTSLDCTTGACPID